MIDDEYYDEQDVELIVRYRLKWNKEDPRAKRDAIKFAMALPMRGGGAGLHGCYGAERVDVDLHWLYQPMGEE